MKFLLGENMRVWKVGVEDVSSNATAPITKVLALNIRLCSSNEVLGLLGYRSCRILGKICRWSEISPCIRHITVNNARAPQCSFTPLGHSVVRRWPQAGLKPRPNAFDRESFVVDDRKIPSRKDAAEPHAH
jgi:hypothetical protein